MITKKLISQTIPTVYNDKNEFNNSSENLTLTSSSFLPPNKQQLNPKRMDIKSVNYFGSKSSTNFKKFNKQHVNSNDLNQAKNSNYYNFNSNSYNFYNTSFSNENLEKFKTNSNSDLNQESFILPKNKQQTFQKYAIERHINHFKPQNLNSNNSKMMITKMLNGNIDEGLKKESFLSSKDTNNKESETNKIVSKQVKYYLKKFFFYIFLFN